MRAWREPTLAEEWLAPVLDWHEAEMQAERVAAGVAILILKASGNG